jgi:hypothetical protein
VSPFTRKIQLKFSKKIKLIDVKRIANFVSREIFLKKKNGCCKLGGKMIHDSLGSLARPAAINPVTVYSFIT